MGSGEVAIVALSTMISLKVTFSDGLGGVTGIVARYQGQQRVGIVIDGLLTMATACIPNAFIEIVKK